MPEPDEGVLTGGALARVFERAGAAVPALGVALVLVDPIGRESVALLLDATPV